MALHGGNPDDLDFKRFLDISYALIVQEYRTKGGMDLMGALSASREWAVGGDVEKDAHAERQNEASLAELERMMRGVR